MIKGSYELRIQFDPNEKGVMQKELASGHVFQNSNDFLDFLQTDLVNLAPFLDKFIPVKPPKEKD